MPGGALAGAAAKLLLLPAFAASGIGTLTLAALAIPLSVVALLDSRTRAVRVEHALTIVAALLLAVHDLPLVRGVGDRSEGAARTLSRAVEERIVEDAELVREAARGLERDLAGGEDGWTFDVLHATRREHALRGRGLKLFDADGRLVAWDGPTLDGLRQAESVRVDLPGGTPARLVVGSTGIGVVARAPAGSWELVLEDPLLRLSPVEALGLPHSGWLADLERRLGVRVEPDPRILETMAEAQGTPPAAPIAVRGVRVATVRLAEVGSATGPGVWMRLAALAALAAAALLFRRTWRAADPRLLEGTSPTLSGGRAELAVLALRLLLVLALRWAIEAGGFLQLLLPGPLSSPLAFASRALGPFSSSPADLLASTLLLLLWMLGAFRAALRWTGAVAGEVAPVSPGSRRAPVRTLAAVGVLLALGSVAHGPLLRAGAALVRDTSTALLFRPDLYSSAEGALLFAGLVAAAASLLLLVASVFVLVEGRTEGRAAARLWPAATALALVAGVVAAAHLTRHGADASPRTLALLLWTLIVSAAYAAAGLARAPRIPGGRWTRRVVGPALVVGLASGLAVTTAHGAGRLWGLRLYMADRLQEMALPSNQWLEYNLRLTGQRLVASGAELGVLVEGSEGASFLAWTRTPLRDLPFPSALLVTDGEGTVLSRFSLLPAQDAELLPRISRAALRAPAEQVGRVQTESGRMLFFTAVPLSGQRPRGFHAVAVVSEALEPSLADETAAYFIRNVFTAGGGEPFVLNVHRGDPVEGVEPALTLASGAGEGRIWISAPLEPYLPDPLDLLSLALTAALATLAFFVVYELLFGLTPIRWPEQWTNPLASFRGRVFAVLLMFVVLPLVVYSWISFQTTRHEIDQATRALAEEALRSAAAFLGPRLRAGGEEELDAILPESARLVGQDLIVYRNGVARASSRPEIFLANLFSRRMPGDLYRRLVFGGERLATERARLGTREVLVAYLRVPGDPGTPPTVLASPLVLREVHILRDQRELLQVLFVMFALSLLALGIFGWLVSRQLSRPLATLKEGADRIARGELAHRLRDPDRSDEFGRLFSAFNTMAAGLQVSQGELLAEKGRVQAILSSIGNGVLALDREGRIQLANETARELLGLPADVVGRRPAELLPAPFWERASKALRAGRRREEEVRLGNGDGERTFHLTFAPLVGEGGERRGLVVVFEDLSQVLAAQRVIAWEEMARQVAHEIKNPLTPIKLSLQHLQRVLRAPSPHASEGVERSLGLVLSEIGRLERIAGEFSRFGTEGPGAQPLDLAAALRDVAELYGRQDGDLRIDTEVAGTPVPVLADEDGLKKVLLNLLENAREAMTAAGSERRVVQLRLDFESAGDRVLVAVRDEGPGIPAEHLDRLFRPYFSTKTRGTGLGLAIARRLVESWGGAIQAGNWERGAEVLLWLEKSPVQLDTPGGGR